MRELPGQISALPGVSGASAGMRVPVRPSGAGAFVDVEGYSPAPDEEMRVEYNYVAPDFFRALGIPLVRGREFDARDAAGAPRVAVINEDMANAWFSGRDPIGAGFTFRGERYIVVGVARNTAWSGLQPGGSPFVFAPALQNAGSLATGTLTFIARTPPGREAALLPLMAERVRAFDNDLATYAASTANDDVATMLAPQRAAAVLLAGFGLLALVLSCVGIYGVVAYGVAQRRRDFGIRMALGASGGRVALDIAREVAVPVAIGSAFGLLAVMALGRAVQSLVFGVRPSDPLTLAAALAILALAAAVATLLPARRAARTHPMEVMRAE
jgi:predicted permease